MPGLNRAAASSKRARREARRRPDTGSQRRRERLAARISLVGTIPLFLACSICERGDSIWIRRTRRRALAREMASRAEGGYVSSAR